MSRSSEFTGRPDDYEGGSSETVARIAASDADEADRPTGRSGPPGTAGPSSDDNVGFGIKGWARWFWRQLTSMKVALILLLLLAVAAIPGSLLPQRSADPNGVLKYESDHPVLFKVLDAFPIQGFDVYTSVWFSAIYLLLFVSLVGCVLPRIMHHWRALRSAPPRTPVRLKRMAGFQELRISNPDATEAERVSFAERAIEEARLILRRQRYRVETRSHTSRSGGLEISVSAERGYLRETGNLVFHIALLGVLVAVGMGGLTSFNAQRVLVEGETMVNQIIDYDTVTAGSWFTSDTLVPYRLRFDKLNVDYVTPDEGNANAIGLVRDFTANVTIFDEDGAQHAETIRVNRPLRNLHTPIFLIANGYAPKVTIRNDAGEVVFSEAVPFIPQDANLTSLGVIKVPYGIERDGAHTQLGLQGFFYPTKVDGGDEAGAFSSYPDLTNPVMTLNVFVGDLGIDLGVPQSVYVLDTSNMEAVAGRALETKSLELRIGDTVDLPQGMGTITLESVPRYAAFEVMNNPTQAWVLVFALIAIAGLLTSLFVPRRRVWVKAIPDEGGVRLEYAALARGDDPTLEAAVAQLRELHRERL